MTATLSIRHIPEPQDRLIVVDCEHGTTTVALLNTKALQIDEATGVAMALERHDAEEQCGCTRQLWRKYGRSST